jgi:iron complex outermembrane receptor protein
MGKRRGKGFNGGNCAAAGSTAVRRRASAHTTNAPTTRFYPHRLSLVGAAVVACLSGGRLTAAADAPAGVGATSASSAATANDATVASSAAAGGQLQEVVVTAQRREQLEQNVPITMQALTGTTLQQVNVQTFDDLVKYLPNVSTASLGPGQDHIFMRGLSVGPDITLGNSTGGDFPNVALYLDNQSVQAPGRNLDVYAADIARIEVLEGPQGTLFGGGAEAGVVRYITNKPNLDVLEGNFTGGYYFTDGGANSGNATGVLNLPLVPGTLAARFVAYDDHRGGYINNVPGTLERQSSDPSIHYAHYANNIPGPSTPVNSLNNNNLVGNAINPVTYDGVRVGLLWKFNEDWNALLMEYFQDMDAEGLFYDTPYSNSGPTSNTVPVPLPPLSIQMYNPSYNHDRWNNTALTVNGRIGVLSLVYAGSFLQRRTTEVQDESDYLRSNFADYYQCVPGQCYSPSGIDWEQVRDDHQTQELRLSTPTTWRLRGLFGVFWENFLIHDMVNFQYLTAPGFTAIGPPPTAYANDPSPRNSNVAFFDDDGRGYQQRAAFGSLDFDILDSLTLTLGTRVFRYDNFEYGSAGGSFGCFMAGPPPCLKDIHNLNAENLRDTDTGNRSHVNLTWHVTADAMLYYTFSQGYRPGGFNRSASLSAKLDYLSPISFAPDKLTNNELGWKTEWLNHTLRFNGAIYQEKWTNVQTSFFDPTGALGHLQFETNGPTYRVRGVETQLQWLVAQGLTLIGSAAWNSSDQLTSPYVYNLLGQQITSVPLPFGQQGSTLADSPPFQGNLRARYEFNFADYRPFVQVGGQHQAHEHTATGYQDNIDLPGFTTYDASVGVAKDQWTVQGQCQNLTNVDAALWEAQGSGKQQLTVTPNRPRTCGMNFSYAFTGTPK